MGSGSRLEELIVNTLLRFLNRLVLQNFLLLLLVLQLLLLLEQLKPGQQVLDSASLLVLTS